MFAGSFKISAFLWSQKEQKTLKVTYKIMMCIVRVLKVRRIQNKYDSHSLIHLSFLRASEHYCFISPILLSSDIKKSHQLSSSLILSYLWGIFKYNFVLLHLIYFFFLSKIEKYIYIWMGNVWQEIIVCIMLTRREKMSVCGLQAKNTIKGVLQIEIKTSIVSQK